MFLGEIVSAHMFLGEIVAVTVSAQCKGKLDAAKMKGNELYVLSRVTLYEISWIF